MPQYPLDVPQGYWTAKTILAYDQWIFVWAFFGVGKQPYSNVCCIKMMFSFSSAYINLDHQLMLIT